MLYNSFLDDSTMSEKLEVEPEEILEYYKRNVKEKEEIDNGFE